MRIIPHGDGGWVGLKSFEGSLDFTFSSENLYRAGIVTKQKAFLTLLKLDQMEYKGAGCGHANLSRQACQEIASLPSILL